MVAEMAVTAEPSNHLEHKGYNRGLILGLTMAESMLLLVFCLLLVAAAIINNERTKALSDQKSLQQQVVAAQQELAAAKLEREDVRQKLQIAEDKLKQAHEQLQALTLASVDREKFEKEWRDLQLAKQELQKLNDSGVTAEKVEEFQKTLVVLKENQLPEDAAALSARLKELSAAETSLAASKPHEWPPIINLSEADGNYFRSGSAELEAAFDAKLRGAVSDQIADALQRYQVDVIEVVGHTDEQPIFRRGSNLDQTVMDVLDGKKSVAGVVPADNAGLGLARAVSVANALKSEGKLKGATILPLSAAQLILPGDVITTGQAGAEETRRRIEIRIRRRNQEQQVAE
ncbi:OmpA family protein [Rhizobium laguerreae]|nr:OmpA family protein [Rhizobium laguerreae]MBY3349920.1 OmpA family protein [Rhizobium laguerreae]MBY3371024.1 OmpA family protein [Rhizobium laguerreae]MBY3426264.1 OmpA family protein [Rhizobium laguerreae]MBY3434184.1 OmpA family protein [Rhizobium laguerreae]